MDTGEILTRRGIFTMPVVGFCGVVEKALLYGKQCRQYRAAVGLTLTRTRDAG